jgi:glycosyltransferase involved in cell wall biosynthesis
MSLRILHIAPYSPDAWAYGGIPRVVADMTRGLAQRGHHVTLCATDAHDGKTRLPSPRAATRWAVVPPSVADGVEWRIFPNLSNRAAYHLQAFAPLGFRAFLDAQAASFDIAHVHACHHVLGVMAARVLSRAGVPWVLSPNGTAPVFERRFAAKHVLRWLGGARVLSGASRVLAVSQAEARQLADLGVPSDRVRQVSNPVDGREFSTRVGGGRLRRERLLGSAPVVLFLGKITPRKHVVTVVEAFSRLGLPDARLVLAGNDLGGLRDALARARNLGVEHRIQVVGLLRGPDRLQAMADADVVVYPSSGEVFGLVPCEALLAGTPVIVGSDSGCAEVIGATGGGLAVEPGDAAALASAVARVLGDRDQWRHDAAAAGRRVERLFDPRSVAASVEAIYHEVLGRARESLSA